MDGFVGLASLNPISPIFGVRKFIRLLEFLGLELRVRPAGKPPTLEDLREEENR
jgi:hypothetical protein